MPLLLASVSDFFALTLPPLATPPPTPAEGAEAGLGGVEALGPEFAKKPPPAKVFFLSGQRQGQMMKNQTKGQV